MTRKPHARPIQPETDETLAELLLGTAAIVLVFILAFILLPVLVR